MGGAVIGDRALVEDACARAWERLLVCQPDRGEHLFAWLRRVAIHEAWALARRDLREVEPAHPDRDWVDAQRSAAADRTERAERTERALEALQALAGLGERERRYMALRVVGWSYKEIAAGCGVTYTNVNRHLVRAHAKLRTIAAETTPRAGPTGPRARRSEAGDDARQLQKRRLRQAPPPAPRRSRSAVRGLLPAGAPAGRRPARRRGHARGAKEALPARPGRGRPTHGKGAEGSGADRLCSSCIAAGPPQSLR